MIVTHKATSATVTNNRDSEDPTWGTYTYDGEGNVTGKTAKTGGDVWSFSYDHLNRLVEATRRDSSNAVEIVATYAYDVFGNRIDPVPSGRYCCSFFEHTKTTHFKIASGMACMGSTSSGCHKEVSVYLKMGRGSRVGKRRVGRVFEAHQLPS